MNAYKDFIVSPIGDRYNNSIRVGEKELVVNTEVFNHQYVNRLARVSLLHYYFNHLLK